MKILNSDLHITKHSKVNYLIHIPKIAELNPTELWPTILFLHGWGESGDDPTAVMKEGLPAYLAERPDFPFIVISPQCPWNTWWPELADTLEALLKQCIVSYPIDQRRIYLTGLSMGGYGAWYLGSRWPDKFAAIAPICGGGYWFHGFPERVAELKKIPVWAFHGAKDDVVPLAMSEELVTLLRDAGGNVKYTIYPEAEHDSWTETYNNPKLYAWFLQHTKQ